MTGENDPKTFLSRKVADGHQYPEQITNLESKEQREYYRFLKFFGLMPDPSDPAGNIPAFPLFTKMMEYEMRMNMSKDKMRAEQLTQMIVGIEQQENIRQGIQPMPKKPGQRDPDVGQL